MNSLNIRLSFFIEKTLFIFDSLLQLALKDAEKIVSINSNSPRPYLLKAYALILVISCNLSTLGELSSNIIFIRENTLNLFPSIRLLNVVHYDYSIAFEL